MSANSSSPDSVRTRWGSSSVPNFIYNRCVPVTSTQLLVFITLIGHAGKDGVFPSYETRALEARLGRRTVIDAVAGLASIGLIVRHHRFDGTGRQHSNLYELQDPEVVFGGSTATKDQPTTSGGAAVAPPNCGGATAAPRSGFVVSVSGSPGSPSLQSPTVTSRECARIAQDPGAMQEPPADSAPTPPVPTPVPALSPVPDWEQDLAEQYGESRLRQALACLREAEARGQVIEHPRAFVLRAIEKGWQPSQRVQAPATVPARGPDAAARLREQWDRENEERRASQEAERRVMAWLESQPADLQDKLRQGALALAQRDIGKLFPEGVPGAVVDGYLYRLAVVAMEDRGTGVDGAETGRELQGGAAASSAAVPSVGGSHDRGAVHVRVEAPGGGTGFAVAPLGDEAASEAPWVALAPAVGAEGLVRPLLARDTPRSAVRLRRADPVNISLGGAVAIRQETG